MVPQTLDALNYYPPNVMMNGLFVAYQLIGYPLFGMTMRCAHDLPAWSGFLIAVGWPLFILAGGLALTVFEPLWTLAILGAFLLGLGLAWVGYTIFRMAARRRAVGGC